MNYFEPKCADFNICGDCFERGVHDHHQMKKKSGQMRPMRGKGSLTTVIEY